MSSINKSYNEDLWDEIPGYAFIALGRRGREEISLRECFVPGCDNRDLHKLHPIEYIVDETHPTEDTKVIQKKYKIFCEHCNNEFWLVFEHFIDLNEGDEMRGLVAERVFATNGDGKENYGEIGWVQPR